MNQPWLLSSQQQRSLKDIHRLPSKLRTTKASKSTELDFFWRNEASRWRVSTWRKLWRVTLAIAPQIQRLRTQVGLSAAWRIRWDLSRPFTISNFSTALCYELRVRGKCWTGVYFMLNKRVSGNRARCSFGFVEPWYQYSNLNRYVLRCMSKGPSERVRKCDSWQHAAY